MNNISEFFKKYLATITFVLMYVVLCGVNFSFNAFSFDTLVFLFITILPFIILGFALDYIINNNINLKFSVKIIAKLLPATVLTLTLLSSAYTALIPDAYPWLLQRLLWLFIALPFMIGSYEKASHKNRMIFSGLGTAAIVLSYLYLTTLTENLDKKYGAFIYFIALFLILYAASNVKNMPFISTVIGIVFAFILYTLRVFPIDQNSRDYGWDLNIANNFEFLILGAFILCIPICFLATFLNNKRKNCIVGKI